MPPVLLANILAIALDLVCVIVEIVALSEMRAFAAIGRITAMQHKQLAIEKSVVGKKRSAVSFALFAVETYLPVAITIFPTIDY